LPGGQVEAGDDVRIAHRRRGRPRGTAQRDERHGGCRGEHGRFPEPVHHLFRLSFSSEIISFFGITKFADANRERRFAAAGFPGRVAAR